MEFLQALFQKRLEQLSRTFLKLVQQLQTTLTPFSEPLLAPHKIEYLVHIIVNTLQDQRQKYINQLEHQLQDMHNQISYNKEITNKLKTRNSTRSRESLDVQLSQISIKMTPSQPNLKTFSRNCSYLQNFSEDASICQSSKQSIKTKTSTSNETFRNTHKARKDSKVDQNLSDQLQYEFKYLRI